MGLVTRVMEELKIKQKTVRYKAEQQQEATYHPQAEGPKGGCGRTQVLGSKSRPPRGATARSLWEGRGTLASIYFFHPPAPPSGPTQAEPGNIACRGQKSAGRTGSGGQKHLGDLCQTLFSALNKSTHLLLGSGRCCYLIR